MSKRPLSMNRTLAKSRALLPGKVGREAPLRADDVVEVKSAAEILATLDDGAGIDSMPFMPEMMQFAGKRLTVSSRVEKICDTVSYRAPNSRRMSDTVLLEDLRCDGSGHGGCQAGCRLYWKESWLRRVDPGSESHSRNGDGPAAEAAPDDGLAQLEELTRAGTRTVRDVDGAPTEAYRCQATEALRATEPLSAYDPRQYIRELTSGNVGLPRVLLVAARALGGMIGRRLRLVSYQPLKRSGVVRLIQRKLPFLDSRSKKGAVAARGALNLQPGEMVEVRSMKEIAPTLDEDAKNRGLSYDWEMMPYSGGRYRVKDRVQRIIDEKTGQMIEIASDCLILDGVGCSGCRSRGRWLCQRAIYAYWREAWLRRADNAPPAS